MIPKVFRHGPLCKGATNEPRGDNPPFAAADDGWVEVVPPMVVHTREEVDEGWEEGLDDDVPPMVVHMGKELDEGWDDDVLPMGEDGPHNDYLKLAEFMAGIPEDERQDPVGRIHLCTSNEAALAVSRQFSGPVIVDDFEKFLVSNNVPMAEDYSFYLDSGDDCDAMIEALLPAATALEYEGTDVHMVILEDGKFNFLKNGTFERWSDPKNEMVDEDEDDEPGDDGYVEEDGDDDPADSGPSGPDVDDPEQDDETDIEGEEEASEVLEVAAGEVQYPSPKQLTHKAGPRLKRLDVLPPVLMETARALADNIQVAVEGVVAIMLAVLGAVLQGRLAIQPKLDPFYLEHLNLYVLLSGPTSSRKSAILKRLTMPLLELQARLRLEAIKAKAVAERALAEVTAKLEQEQDLDPAEADYLYAQKADLERQLLRTGQFIVQDMTPEALAKMLYSEGALLIRMDEIHIATLLGSRWGNGNNETLLLQCYTGEDYTVNRASSEPMEIKTPLLAIAAGTQPSVVDQLLNDDEFVLRGGAGRFLFVTPHLTFGDRPYESPPVPEPVWADFVAIIEALSALPMNRHEPQRLLLADDARALISDFFIETDRKLERCFNDPKMSGLLGKLTGTTNRIAGILHAVRYADENAGLERRVSAETMADAIELARFFAAHAEVAMSSAKSGVALQEVLWKKILELELDQFRASELWQMLKGSAHFKVMDNLKKALDGLTDRHYLLPCPVVDTGAPGRKPSPKYRVNPRALALDDHNDNDDQF